MSLGPNDAVVDKTVNKVAMCSAMFAGFAYVGYSVVRHAVYRRDRRRLENFDEDECPATSLFFRRLSLSSHPEMIINAFNEPSSGRMMLRPLSVQERIRELNMRAMEFSDTLLAIKSIAPNNNQRIPLPLPCARSLQSSPFNSPRLLSPEEVHPMIPSQSSENIFGSPIFKSKLRRRFSFKGRGRKPPPVPPLDSDEMDRLSAEYHKLVISEKKDMCGKLDELFEHNRDLSPTEAKTLAAFLYSPDDNLLRKTVVTISNCATFSRNQDSLREAGCLLRLQNILTNPNEEIQLAAVKAIGNLSLNDTNIKEMKVAVNILLNFIEPGNYDKENLLLATLISLTNIAVYSDWHEEYIVSLSSIFNVIHHMGDKLQLQAYRLLINLSCNLDVTPGLLSAQVPFSILQTMDTGMEDILLRLVTLVANVVCNVKQLQGSSITELTNLASSSNSGSLAYQIYSVSLVNNLREKAFYLTNKSSNEDIRIQSRRIYETLKE